MALMSLKTIVLETLSNLDFLFFFWMFLLPSLVKLSSDMTLLASKKARSCKILSFFKAMVMTVPSLTWVFAKKELIFDLSAFEFVL